MKVVLDTNALFVSVSRKSKFHPVFEAFENGQYELLVTTDILQEYEEIIGDAMGATMVNSLFEGFRLVPNVKLITKYYRWQLITHDPDDDKFVDCAVAGNADFIVSDDHHFRVLRQIPFPKVQVITIADFFEMLTGYKLPV